MPMRSDPSLWFNLPGVVAAYQPVGAPNPFAGRQNAGNDGRMVGRYTATPVIAPAWSAEAGWILDNTHSLLTGISAGPGMSILVRFRNASGPTEWRPVIGDSSTFPRLVIWPSGSGCTYDAGGSLSVAPYLAAGVLGIAGQQGYRNGVADGGTIPTETGTWGTIRVGLIADYGAGFVGNIQAVAISSIALSPTAMWRASRQMQYCDVNSDWSVWGRQRQYYFAPTAAAAVFQVAWAKRANRLIGGS